MSGFASFDLEDETLQRLQRQGFRNPTPVQRKAIPVIMSGRDSIVMARTGSGKTLAFLIPLLNKKAVVVSPTRELSQQTLRVLRKLTSAPCVGIHGGDSMEKQFESLSTELEYIVATPGRLSHLLDEIPDFNLNQMTVCVLDEADRLLEMGFAPQISTIHKSLHSSCQKVMVSATLPKALVEFTRSGFCRDPHMVRLDADAKLSDSLRCSMITCRSSEKDAALLEILDLIRKDTAKQSEIRTGLTVIFAATRHHVEYLSVLLQHSQFECTVIYGTLDTEARQQNLAKFKSRKVGILIVTDVAARGIDIPLIDHVIHYNFPASPKLFIHRSGRAGRAGRIGFGWGIVEPDEMAYMVDLYLFLRKPLLCSSSERYGLDDADPEKMYYGSLPEAISSQTIEKVQRILHSELSGSAEAQSLRSLTKVCANAMKQYKKTRPEASREGIRRAKEILEGKKEITGKRNTTGAIPSHPLLRQDETPELQKRDEFLKAMAQFRPRETVFEAFATQKESGVVSHLDRGRTSSLKQQDRSYVAMRDMRRQMRMARDKGNTLVVAGTQETPDEKSDLVDDPVASKVAVADSKPPPKIEGKRRMSKAERKRQKKGKTAANPTNSAKSTSYRDPQVYIESGFSTSQDAAHSRRVEQAMLSSATERQSAATRLEESILDIVGDENDDIVKKQRMMRWDKSKRKYIKTTIGQETANMSKSKKLRLESGQLVKSDRLKLGEVYEKWQKKTKKAIGHSGVFDDEGHSGEAAEVKDSTQIRKDRQTKERNKVKNMKRSERRKLQRNK